MFTYLSHCNVLPKIWRIIKWTKSVPKYLNPSVSGLAFRICMTWLAKIDRLARKIFFAQKIASKGPQISDNFWDIITLKGAGRQTSTSSGWLPQNLAILRKAFKASSSPSSSSSWLFGPPNHDCSYCKDGRAAAEIYCCNKFGQYSSSAPSAIFIGLSLFFICIDGYQDILLHIFMSRLHCLQPKVVHGFLGIGNPSPTVCPKKWFTCVTRPYSWTLNIARIANAVQCL